MSHAAEPIRSDESGTQPGRLARKRIPIVAVIYAPELVSCANYATEVAEELPVLGMAFAA